MPKLFSDNELQRTDLDILKVRLRHKLGGYTVAFKNINAGNHLYRGVPWSERPDKIDDVSYPPPEKAKQNRANRAGRSMFYCSVAAPAVFYELRAKKGDRVALSQWEIIEPLWMHNLGFHLDALRKLGSENVPMRPQLSNLIPNETKKNAKLRRKLSLAFTGDIRDGQEYRYKQSIAINELLFDGASPIPLRPNGPKSNRVAGTVYPAMQMRGAADNVVIWPEFVDSSLSIKSVRYVLVEAANEKNFSYTFLTLAYSHTFSGGNIVWHENLAPEIQRRSHIAIENDKWILRDGMNNIYDIH